MFYIPLKWLIESIANVCLHLACFYFFDHFLLFFEDSTAGCCCELPSIGTGRSSIVLDTSSPFSNTIFVLTPSFTVLCVCGVCVCGVYVDTLGNDTYIHTCTIKSKAHVLVVIVFPPLVVVDVELILDDPPPEELNDMNLGSEFI